ncbi:hypothetical protein TNCV_1838271 [Trichonephila clavipes]|nr:hypothetical protein TNCV_1838271 [Trichonephila clavipes]
MDFAFGRLFYKENRGMSLVQRKCTPYRKIRSIEQRDMELNRVPLRMDFTEINFRGKRGELLGRIDRQNSRFRTAKTIIIKFGLDASFVVLESSKNAVNEESQVNTSKEPFFFPEFDTNRFSSFKSFLDCFDQQCLEYQKDEQWKKQNIARYLTGVYLKFWYENHLFEKSYQESKELLMTVFDATKQEDIRKFPKLKLNDTKELISFFTEKLSLGKKLNYDDSSIVEHMTLSSPIQYKKFLVIKKISTPCEWISTMRQLIAVTPDSADRKPVDTGSYTRWYNQADGSVHRGTDPRNRFQLRGNHGQPHQSHMMSFNGRQQFNSQPRQFVQQNRHNFHSPRNENNQRQG